MGRQTAHGARVRRPWRDARTAHLGRHRVDPAQPAATTGAMLMATTPTWTTLVQAEALAEALGNKDLVVVDCRVSLADRGAGERLWRESHIPGAVYADLGRERSEEHTDELRSLMRN